MKNPFVITECSITTEFVLTEFHCSFIFEIIGQKFFLRFAERIIYKLNVFYWIDRQFEWSRENQFKFSHTDVPGSADFLKNSLTHFFQMDGAVLVSQSHEPVCLTN